MWWLALGWSLAEVTAGIAQEYEALALYRDVLVPEGEARELVAKVVAAAGTAPLKNGGSDGSSPRAADERLRESLSRGEEGGPAVELAGSPVSGRQHQKSQQTSSRSSWMALANDAEIRIEVDKDFDALVAVKARDELEELYGCPVIVSLWNLLFITVADYQLCVNCSACLCSCFACCASRRYYSPSALCCSYQQGTSPRLCPRRQLRNTP